MLRVFLNSILRGLFLNGHKYLFLFHFIIPVVLITYINYNHTIQQINHDITVQLL